MAWKQSSPCNNVTYFFLICLVLAQTLFRRTSFRMNFESKSLWSSSPFQKLSDLLSTQVKTDLSWSRYLDIGASFKKQDTCCVSVGADPTSQPTLPPSSCGMRVWCVWLCHVVSDGQSVASKPACWISRQVLKPATTSQCQSVQSVHRHQAWPRWPSLSLLLHFSKPRW